MTDVVTNIINEKKIPYLSSFPEELENVWVHVHKFENHPTLSLVVSLYKNDDFKRGTVIVSPYFYHKYPDVYCIYTKDIDGDTYIGARAYTNPKYRGRGYWKWFILFLRSFLYNNLQMYTDVSPERNSFLEKAYVSAHIIAKKTITKYFNDGKMFTRDGKEPRDPCFPDIWYNQRVGGKVEENNK
jgi:GNAT superfamily N-acetyltransferase